MEADCQRLEFLFQRCHVTVWSVNQRKVLWVERVLLATIIVVFCFRVGSLHPREFFGFYQDDAVYFSTAKALAAGHGYVFPSFPGVLPQTKYPILYPLILSAVWRISPTFPQNLSLAIGVSIAIAAVYLVLSYIFIRRSGASMAIGLGVLAAIALHPELEWFAGVLLSDYLFALLVVASALAADESWLSAEHPLRWGLIAGLLLGLSMLARSAGIGAIAGIALYGALQRRWRTLLLILIVCGTLVSIGVVATNMISPAPVAAGAGTPPNAFQRVAAYNGSYARFWLLSVPKWSVLGAMLRTNLRLLIAAPGRYFVMPGVTLPVNVFTFALTLLVTALSLGGIIRLYRSSPRRSMVFAMVGSLPILLLWNYVIYDRFLLPFVPLIFLGIAIEFSRLASMLRGTLWNGTTGNRVAGGAIAILLIGLAGTGVYDYVQFARGMKPLSEALADLNRERRQAYEWISNNSSPRERVVAYADGLTSLYTNRQSVRPVEVTTDCFYQPERERCAVRLDDIIASIRYVNAKYWVITPSDYGLAGSFEPELRQDIAAALQSRLKPVFVSGDGTVTVYDTTCMVDPKDTNCPQ